MPYARDNGIMPANYDNAFKKIISSGWAQETEGSVDEFGFFALIPIPRAERDELVAACFDEDDNPEDIPHAGYYITKENDQGILTAYTYDRRGDMEADWENLLSELYGSDY